jgi:hypothetical protein
MAVSVDTVYQRVLAIANKEQRGYITPQEFNLLANQAQMEIFEQYFYDINQFERVRPNDTEYSNPLHILEEKISLFKVSQNVFTLLSNTPGYLASFSDNILTGDDANFTSSIGNFALTTALSGTVTHDAANDALVITNALQDGGSSETSTRVFLNPTVADNVPVRVRVIVDTTNLPAGRTFNVTFNDVTSIPVFGSTGVQSIEFFSSSKDAGETDILTLRMLSATTVGGTDEVSILSVEIGTATGNRLQISTSSFYRLGSVVYTDSNSRNIEVQGVTTKEYIDISSGPLTKPTTKQPVYVRLSQNTLSLHPSEIANDTVFNFIRKPLKVNWAYNVVDEKALFNSTQATDFELHDSEETSLVNRILELAGILLQKPDLQGSGKDKIISEIQQEKA